MCSTERSSGFNIRRVRRLLGSAALFLLLLAHPSASQSLPDTPPTASAGRDARPSRTPDDIIDRAFALVDGHRPLPAERMISPLLQRMDLTSRQRARAERVFGQALSASGRPDKAAEAFARALDAALAAGDRGEAGWARRWVGTIHYGEGRPAEARTVWEIARDDFAAVGDVLGEFEVLDDIAVSVSGIDRRPYVERCFAIARDRRDPLLEARARVRWAHGLLEGAQPGPALIESERAASLLRPLGPAAHDHLAATLATLAWALRAHGSNARAVAVHREAIRLARATGDVDEQVWNYFGLGTALVELRRFDEADAAMREARAAAARTGNKTTIRIVSESDGWIAMKRGDWTRAVSAIEASIARPGTEVTSMPLINLSEAYLHTGRADDALAAASKAVELSRQLRLDDNELRALIALAHAQDARGDLAAAGGTLEDIVARVEKYRAALAPSDFLKQGFSDRFTDAYGLLVHLRMRQGRPAEALEAAERVRARAFGDLLLARRIRERDESDGGYWLLGADSKRASQLEVDSPIAAPALDTPRLVDLARRLDTAILSYWIHPSGSFAWVIRPDGTLHGAPLAVDPRRLDQEIRRVVDVPPDVEVRATAATTTVSRSYRRLYNWLWAPVVQWLPTSPGSRVTIIPHGPLFACPFAALRDPAGTYVIERHALHYAGSGTVLIEAVERSAHVAREDGRALIVADAGRVAARSTTRGSAASALDALPAARREARGIQRALGMPSDVLVGEAASESAVRARLPGARIAHFATHAIVTGSDPLGSHLVLARPSASATDDGRLTASELAGVETSAKLVVLGACRSARGPVSSDGIAGLTRAVMAAGSPSVIATLWDIADEPTALLMVLFYKQYAAHRPKDEALRLAQLAVLEDLRAGRVHATVGQSTVTYPEHPWLWAAPILVGAP
jgi:CHAT domain-containing protein/tetratricopeptide (TPR) repeat protein